MEYVPNSVHCTVPVSRALSTPKVQTVCVSNGRLRTLSTYPQSMHAYNSGWTTLDSYMSICCLGSLCAIIVGDGHFILYVIVIYY
jgi:hypothetical protein